MLLLAIEAAAPSVTLALGEGPAGARRVLAEQEIAPGPNASVQLPGVVPELLARAGKKLSDLGGLVVGTGPGSLTGLRVAHATAKGLAYSLKLPLLGLSSLETMAWEAPAGAELCVPVLDARRSEVYAGLFRRSAGGLEVLESALALTPVALAERLRNEGPLRIFGLGEPLVREAFQAAGVAYTNEGPEVPHAKALLERAPEPGAFDLQAIFALEPRYVRAPETEWTLKPKKPRV